VSDEFIPLDKFSDQQKKERVKQQWKTMKGLGFYTEQGALLKVTIIQGSVTGTQLMSFDKGKQRLALLPNDAKKLADAIYKLLGIEKK